MSGGYRTNRIVTFSEVFLSRAFYADGRPDRDDGFVSYAFDEQKEQSGTVSITRTDGKILSFDVNIKDGIPVIEIGGNVIRWSAFPEYHSDGPFH